MHDQWKDNTFRKFDYNGKKSIPLEFIHRRNWIAFFPCNWWGIEIPEKILSRALHTWLVCTLTKIARACKFSNALNYRVYQIYREDITLRTNSFYFVCGQFTDILGLCRHIVIIQNTRLLLIQNSLMIFYENTPV